MTILVNQNEDVPLTESQQRLLVKFRGRSLEQGFSAQELAGLPGVPGTPSGVIRKAKKEGWQFGDRRGLGGERYYSIASLPSETQKCLIDLRQYVNSRQHKKAGWEAHQSPDSVTKTHVAPIVVPIKGNMPFQDRSPKEKAQLRLDARVEILSLLKYYRQANGLTVLEADTSFSQLYNDGQVAVEPWIREVTPTLSRRKLSDWRSLQKQYGTARLTGNYQHTRTRKIDATLQEAILGILWHSPFAKATHILECLKLRFPNKKLPKLRALQEFLKNWKIKNAEIYTAISDPNKWNSNYLSAFGSYSEGLERNERTEFDDTPGDFILDDGRYKLIAGIEVSTRAVVVRLDKTSNATNVSLTIRDLIKLAGVMDEIIIDRGSPFNNKHVKRGCQDLDINLFPCLPANPWQKPHIERFFKTLLHGLLELLVEFIGHSVEERKTIEARERLIDAFLEGKKDIVIRRSKEQMQPVIAAMVHKYMHSPHSGLNGRTPTEALAESVQCAQWIDDERKLDVLLAPAPGNDGIRRVHKKGVRIEKDWYIAPELEAYIGQNVHVRYDVDDLGQVFIFDEEIKYICIAGSPSREGINRADVAVNARNRQQKRIKKVRKDFGKLSRKIKAESIADELLEQEQRLAETQIPDTNRQFHDTPALKAVGQALAAQEQKKKQSSPSLNKSVEQFQKILVAWRAGVQLVELSPNEVGETQKYLQSEEGRRIASALTTSPVEMQQFEEWFLNSANTETQKIAVNLHELLATVYHAWEQGLAVDASNKSRLAHFISQPSGRGLLRGLASDGNEEKAFKDWLVEKITTS